MMKIIIDGLPKCGVEELAKKLEWDTGIPWLEMALDATPADLSAALEDTQVLILSRHLLHLSGVMADAVVAGCDDEGLARRQWGLLDAVAARHGAWYICLLDTPRNVHGRMKEASEFLVWTRERLGYWLQAMNHAIQVSQVRQKGTYRISQFLNPETGEPTDQYRNLVRLMQEKLEENHG